MKNTPLKILMLEDDENDARLLETYLKKSHLNVISSTWVSSKEAYIKALNENDFDVILSDHNLPEFSSLAALKIRNEKKMHVPFVLVSGAIPEAFAVTLLQEGANDYIIKDRPERLPAAIEQAIKRQADLAEKIQAEKALKKAVERFELAAKASFDVIWDFDFITNKVYFNEAFKKAFGYPSGENLDPVVLGDYIYENDVTRIKEEFEQFIKSREIKWSSFFKMKKADGSVAHVKQNVIVLRDGKGYAYRAIGVIEDITEILLLQNELVAQKINRQKEITEVTINAQEKERTEIGKELHDNVNQLLASAKMLIEAGLRSPDMHDMCMQKSIESLNAAINEVRNISHAMITPSFDEGQFLLALEELVDNINLSGKIYVVLDIHEEDLQKINADIKLASYRIIQEQLNNIIKHSGATEVEISVKTDDEGFKVCISDNGNGFDPSLKKNGVGLKNIYNRAELNNGRVQINSAPGEGCKMNIIFSLEKNNSLLSDLV